MRGLSRNADSLTWRDYYLIGRTIIEAARGFRAARKWWKTADPWTKWGWSTGFAAIICGSPGVAVAAMLGIVFHINPNPNPQNIFDTTPMFLPAVAMGTDFFVGPRIWSWIDRVFDLDYPTFRCATEDCRGSLSSFTSRQLKNAPQPFQCPHCGHSLQRVKDRRRGAYIQGHISIRVHR